MHDVIRDNELLNRTKNSELIKLKRNIIPSVHDTSEQMFNHSKIVSPITRLDYVHKREECEKRKDIEESRSSTTKKINVLNLNRIENSIQLKSTTKNKIKKIRSAQIATISFIKLIISIEDPL